MFKKTCHYLQAISILLFSLVLNACGGGSGGGNNEPEIEPTPPPAEAAFGLTQRVSLAPFQLPSENGDTDDISLSNAFPQLSFAVPLYVAGVPGENRLVVVEQSGQIHAFANISDANSSRVVLDLENSILFSGEQGLLGLAFDPNFTSNRLLYVYYSLNNPRRSVISQFRWDTGSDLIAPGSERIILEIPQPFGNHNGGMLAFGPDNFLYIGLGDGGSGGDPQNNAQNTANLLGSMLRIDVNTLNNNPAYTIPASNPFLNQSGFRPEIYAYGLRNPFRFSFDRQTGELWVGDVGQGAREEIDLIVSGGNYGWRVFEGTRPFDSSANNKPNSDFIPPVFEYGRSEGGSITGGYVYRGTAVPALFGHYLYADFASGNVWALDRDDGSNGEGEINNELIASASSPSSFGETNEGEVLLVSRSGSLFKFVSSVTETGPPATLSASGLFADITNLIPAAGLIEYTLQQDAYNDGVRKRYWLGVADNQKIDFDDDDWELPEGSVVIQQLSLRLNESDASSERQLETRVLVNSNQDWLGFNYRWNDEQTGATLLQNRESQSFTYTDSQGDDINLRYDFPNRVDCLRCHNGAEEETLALRTPQLNRDFDYPATKDNQLRSMNHIQLFDTDIGAASQYAQLPSRENTALPLENRARSYLDINCSHCHQPGGNTGRALDLRLETDNMQAINQAPSNSAGPQNSFIISPGSKENSTLWLRMNTLSGGRMPPLGSHVIDESGVDLVGEWIDSL